MKGQRLSPGFTVIEVVLFLAITGLMLAGLMVGIGGAVDRERYNDAVTSLHDFLQGQYNLVDNVNTSRPATYSCSTGGIKLADDISTGQPKGTSDCSIVGRLITSDDGRAITAQPIYATADITTIPDDIPSESDLLAAMGLSVAGIDLPDNQQNYNVGWDTEVYLNGNPDQKEFSLALVRLHTNSLIRSFVVADNREDVNSVIDDATPMSSAVFCVATGGMIGSAPIGVKLLPAAANSNSLQRTVASDGEC